MRMMFVAALSCALVATIATPTHARPAQQWAQASPERQQFFKNAMRPDGSSPPVSCCGDADAYETDMWEVGPNHELIAVLTCNDPENCKHATTTWDEEGYEIPIPVFPAGKRVIIPPSKVLAPHQPDNNTGHGWVFLNTSGDVLCYAPPAGL